MPESTPPTPPEEDQTRPASSLSGPPRAAESSQAAESLEGAKSLEGDETFVSDGRLVDPGAAYAGLRPRDLGKALVGQKIDSVLLEEFIGGGGMGAVFRGRDTALQRSVAVKVLATHNPASSDLSRRFEIEAQSAARLDHPNIARIYHVGEDHGLQYIVFEYIEGQNLRDLVADYGPQPVKNVLSYGIQLADALAHAWERKVVHRDIKPSNILVTPQGQAKLVDMGLARMHQVEAGGDELTATGATLGTFDYIAPEQARDPRDADIRSDIYSLGCTLYFLLIGKPPFPDGTALQKLLRHQGDQPPEVRGERPDVPKAFARVLQKMLAKRPEARHQNPVELVRDLWGLAQPGGVAPPSSLLAAPPPTAAGEFWRRHTPWVASVALLLGLAFALPGLIAPAATPRTFESIEASATPTRVEPVESEPTDLSAEADGPIAEQDLQLEVRGGLPESGEPPTPAAEPGPIDSLLPGRLGPEQL